MTTIRDIAKEYQNSTGCILPFSGTDNDLMAAMISDWRDTEKLRAEITKLERVTDDLAMLVKRLAQTLRKAAPTNELAAQAMDHMKRNGLEGSPLRDV